MTRDAIAEKFLDAIPYALYPVQEEALLAWFSCEQGVLVCAPTGTGKTLIAEAAVFEALHSKKRMYYTTPLIALTDQKFRDLQKKVEEWGFSPDDVGLVTGNHKVNPNAPILVVVAEILFNRLLHPEQFDFADVHSVVMDEFHNFNDPERGIVWEFSLALLPTHVRLMLLSATVGNAMQFSNWLEHEHGRKLELVQSDERKVPLVFQWVGDMTLVEQIQWMALGKEEERCTPALVFCFNREECWSVAEEIKGKELIMPAAKSALVGELARFDWSQGAGPKLKALLQRGVGVHHAGILPRYRRIVEYLFQQKLLAICTCTETLSAGINLPARSVVLPSLMKGPAGRQTMIDPGSAHQIFGRAGRPQFDTRGHVFVLAHEDDVRIARWQEKFDKLPADSKDPKVLAEKKSLKKKQPKRNPNLQYWNEAQFNKLRHAAASNLESRGVTPWRLLAYMLNASPDVELLRTLVKKRLLFGKRLDHAQDDLERMIATLWSGGFVNLEPLPPADWYPRLRRPDVPMVVPSLAAPSLNAPSLPDAKSDISTTDVDNAASNLVEKSDAAFVENDVEEHVENVSKASAFGAGIFDDAEELSTLSIPESQWGVSPQSDDVEKPLLIQDEASADLPNAPVEETPQGANAQETATPVDNLVEKTQIITPRNESLTLNSRNQKDEVPPQKREPKKAYTFVNGIAVLNSELNEAPEEKPRYVPLKAYPTEDLTRAAQMRSIHPIYGTFLLQYLPFADREERIQVFESLLELPYSLGAPVRVPNQDDLPRGRLAKGFLDQRLLELGLALPEELIAQTPEERRKRRDALLEPIYTIPFAEKMFRLFQFEYPLVSDARIFPVWAAGELLKFNGNFNSYITSKGLQKQEGMIFRHTLRLILLLGEFLELDLPCGNSEEWRNDLQSMIDLLTLTCERADPSGTREMLDVDHAATL
ncbi:MAG: DEAD/DEAH box helicase [Planctomycetia bacterium]|nr:DEAD/DEAH box helicase [Planctomycetia bacterium]